MGGVFKSTNGGASWTAVNAGLTDTSIFALAIDPSVPAVYAATHSGVFKSVNGGANWATVNIGLTNFFINALAIDPSSPSTIYAGTYGGGVVKSTGGGGNWMAVNAGLTVPFVYALAVDPLTPTRIHAGTGGGAFDFLDIEPCVAGPTTLCLSGGRFKVTTRWATSDGRNGVGQANTLTGDTGYFTFFNPGNVEMLVKVLNGCGVNSRFWTFAGGLTERQRRHDGDRRPDRGRPDLHEPAGDPFPADPGHRRVCDMPGRRDRGGAGARRLCPDVPASPVVTESMDARAAVPCVANATTLCLSNSRYKVQTQWFAPTGGNGEGQVILLTGDTGAFWFFTSSNVEMVIKVLNGCSLNSNYWTFAGGLTNVNVILTVTDTQTGIIKTYINPQGSPFQPIQDTSAFATCP